MTTTTRWNQGIAILEPTGKIINSAVPDLREQ